MHPTPGLLVRPEASENGFNVLAWVLLVNVTQCLISISNVFLSLPFFASLILTDFRARVATLGFKFNSCAPLTPFPRPCPLSSSGLCACVSPLMKDPVQSSNEALQSSCFDADPPPHLRVGFELQGSISPHPVFLANLMARWAARPAPTVLILSSSRPTIAFSKVLYLASHTATSRPRLPFGYLTRDGPHSPLHPPPPETVVATNVSSTLTPGKLPHLNISFHRSSPSLLRIPPGRHVLRLERLNLGSPYHFGAFQATFRSSHVLSTPIYTHFNITTQSKTLLIRFHGAWSQKIIRKPRSRSKSGGSQCIYFAPRAEHGRR